LAGRSDDRQISCCRGYEGEEHLRQTEEVAAKVRQQAASIGGVRFTGVDTYEVIGQA
jgi:hypothetical protein